MLWYGIFSAMYERPAVRLGNEICPSFFSLQGVSRPKWAAANCAERKTLFNLRSEQNEMSALGMENAMIFEHERKQTHSISK